MNKLTIFLFGCALVLGAAAHKRTFTGVISDSMCGADHSMMGVKPDAKCVHECVRNGSKYVLVVGPKIYILSDQQTPEKFAAQKVMVTGTLDSMATTLTVDKIEPVK